MLYTGKIQKKIIEYIKSAEHSICVAVAWFTNHEILGEISEKAGDVTCKIVTRNDEINSNLDVGDYLANKGQYRLIDGYSNHEKRKNLHDKFILVDNKKALLGSYNFTNSAERYNYESMVEINDSHSIKALALRFEFIFNKAYEIKENELLLAADPKAVYSQRIDEFESEIEFQLLADSLRGELFKSIEICENEGIGFNYELSRDFLRRHGPIGGPKKLMSRGPDDVQGGFATLREHSRLDLSFEYIITKDQYRVLFDDETIRVASERLG
jgi:hypothetical protein